MQQQAYELLVKNISTDNLELLRVIIGKELNERIIASKINISEGESEGGKCVMVTLPKFVDMASVFEEYGKCKIKYHDIAKNDGTGTVALVIALVFYNNHEHLINALCERAIINEAIQALVLSC